MPVIVENENGCIIDHLKASVVTIDKPMTGETGTCSFISGFFLCL